MEGMKSLTTFAQVAQSGSLTGAARVMGMTTPAVSKIISRLEKELGVRLFKRTTRQLSLTSEGHMFLGKVNAALAQIDQGIDQIREARNEPVGTVRILTNAAIGKDYLLPAMAEFLDRYPKVDLEIRFDDGISDLVAEGYDLALQNGPSRAQSHVSRHLIDLPLILVASPSYLARHGHPRSAEELAGFPCVTIRQKTGVPAAWEFVPEIPAVKPRRSSSRVRPVLHHPTGRLLVVEQYDAVLNAALAGLGATVVFAQSALRYLESGELKVLLPDYEVRGGSLENNEVYLRYPHREFLPFNVRAMIDHLVAYFRERDRFRFSRRQYAM